MSTNHLTKEIPSRLPRQGSASQLRRIKRDVHDGSTPTKFQNEVQHVLRRLIQHFVQFDHVWMIDLRKDAEHLKPITGVTQRRTFFIMAISLRTKYSASSLVATSGRLSSRSSSTCPRLRLLTSLCRALRAASRSARFRNRTRFSSLMA